MERLKKETLPGAAVRTKVAGGDGSNGASSESVVYVEVTAWQLHYYPNFC
jgi:hypothetical protein